MDYQAQLRRELDGQQISAGPYQRSAMTPIEDRLRREAFDPASADGLYCRVREDLLREAADEVQSWRTAAQSVSNARVVLERAGYTVTPPCARRAGVQGGAGVEVHQVRHGSQR